MRRLQGAQHVTMLSHDELPPFEENAWVPESRSDARPLSEILDEYQAVRGATLALARSLPPEAMTRQGVANSTPMSVRAAFWNVAGHELHHLKILRERYGISG